MVHRPPASATALLVSLLLLPVPALALDTNEVLVVANRFARGSVDLARYYMEQRAIPEENLLIVRASDKEDTSREDYVKDVARPVRAFLEERRAAGKIYRCLALMYGMPLKVAPTALTREERTRLERLRKEKAALAKRSTTEADDAGKKEEARKEIARIEKEIGEIGRQGERAALDSELALVLEEHYELNGWVANPLFAAFRGKDLPIKGEKVLLVSRLDGPTDTVVRGIIDDSLAAEATGLRGTAYFDARWKDPGEREVTGYALYDRSIHRSADFIKKSGKMPVVLDEKDSLFQPGEAPDAALYCGWYSLGRYVDAFTWKQGAVGYHLASSECSTLKKKDSTVWCKMMLEKGVAATIGPVSEPYVQAFPVPEIFFPALLSGELTLVESAFVSMPFLSWQMVVIGDPLYRPFRKTGA